MNKTELEILEAAENMVRDGGYNAFSFREIAKEVGIKSSSVHYHFPTKEDLGAAVAGHYTDKFFISLGNPEDIIANRKDPLTLYVNAFKTVLTKDKCMCLCGLLGAEINDLPPKVMQQTKIFFERNIDWLEEVFLKTHSKKNARKKAIQTLALLEGGMILGNVLENLETFNDVIEYIPA